MLVNLRVILIHAFVILISTKDCLACFNATTIEHVISQDSSPYFSCECEDASIEKPFLEWRGPTEQAIGPTGTQGAHTEMDQSGRKLNLFFSEVADGVYQCVSIDRHGQMVVATHRVIAPPKMYFYNCNSTQFLVKDQDSLLTCQVRSNQDVVDIDWFRNNVQIRNNSKYSIEETGLRVKNVKFEDAGEYICTATGAINGETVEKPIKAEIYIEPRIQNYTAIPSDIVTEGDTLVIECNAEGYPEPTYSFIKIPHSNNLNWTQQHNRIIIEDITDEHRGVYECTAQNEAGIQKKQITIEVNTVPQIKFFENQTAPEGSEVRFLCQATGRPRPKVVVNKVDSDVKQPYLELNLQDFDKEFQLIFDKVSRKDSGNYYCNASNEVDYTIEEAYLEVLFKPTFEKTKETIYAWEGKQVSLICDYESLPLSAVSWRYYGKVSGSKDNFFQTYIYNYHEAELNITDNIYYGTYECTARNELGENKKLIEVKEGTLPPKIDATNILISDVTATSVTFNIEYYNMFDRPALTGFIAEYDVQEAYKQISVHPTKIWANGRKNVLNDLKPSSTYSIRFAAINEMGQGEYSDYVNFDTPDKSPPDALHLESNSEYLEIPADQQILKLKPVKDNGSPVTFYSVKFCPINEGSAQCLRKHLEPMSEVHLDYFKLKPNTTYSLELQAHNALGRSEVNKVTVVVLDTKSPQDLLTTEAIIGISILVVILCILLLDLLLYFTFNKGIIASCCHKRKSRKEQTLTSRDKKELLNGEADTLKADNGPKEFEYNKETGVITGKHSAV